MNNVTNSLSRHKLTPVLDNRSVQRQFARIAENYDSTSLLQQEIADELIDRIEIVNPTTNMLLDLGSGTGYLGRSAKEKLLTASVIEIDRVEDMAVKASKADPEALTIIATAEKLPLAAASVPLVVSNLLLHWCDVTTVFREVARVLEIGGAFLFSTLGPDTLMELRMAWEKVDDLLHVHSFTDMHDLGDALVAAGFSEPVLDVDRVNTTYETVPQLVEELRYAGGTNARLDRRKTWTGKERYGRFVDSCEVFRKQGQLSLTWEVIYGLATKDRTTLEGSIPVITLPGTN